MSIEAIVTWRFLFLPNCVRNYRDNLHNNIQNFSSKHKHDRREIDKVIKENERTSLPCINNPILYTDVASSNKKRSDTPNFMDAKTIECSSTILSKDVCYGKTIYCSKGTSNYDGVSNNTDDCNAYFIDQGSLFILYSTFVKH